MNSVWLFRNAAEVAPPLLVAKGVPMGWRVCGFHSCAEPPSVPLPNAGKTAFGADGTVEFGAGPQYFLDYFVNGDSSVVNGLCAALGA